MYDSCMIDTFFDILLQKHQTDQNEKIKELEEKLDTITNEKNQCQLQFEVL